MLYVINNLYLINKLCTHKDFLCHSTQFKCLSTVAKEGRGSTLLTPKASEMSHLTHLRALIELKHLILLSFLFAPHLEQIEENINDDKNDRLHHNERSFTNTPGWL